MLIQITFDKPYEISALEDPNFVELHVYNTTLFKRKSDNATIEPSTIKIEKLPAQVNQ